MRYTLVKGGTIQNIKGENYKIEGKYPDIKG
jgi:hypothetical protein